VGAHLARFKIPRAFHVTAELPRTAYGKVQKHLLLDKIQGSKSRTQEE
jgi:acyl-CoA synthetase (AMP-forming)/AMP-acid ligase II